MAACFSPVVSAQPSGAQGNDFLYKVLRNDNLISLAAKYTNSEQNWRALQELNHVTDPRQLPIGMQLRIPFHMIPQIPGDAIVSHVSGDAWLDQQSLKAGAAIAEGNTIRTGSRGFVALRLSDGSTITIPPDASVSIKRLRVFQKTPLTDTILSIENGQIDSTVAPEKTGVGRFEVHTPVSITGVRGTRLRVQATADGANSVVIEGSAQLNTSNNDSARLQANQGATISNSGQLQGVSTLLAAPQLPAIDPADHSGRLAFPPVNGAESYLVRVTTDPEGHNPVSRQLTQEPVATFSRSARQTYLQVRAIDPDGIGGPDGVTAIPAGRALLSSDGTPVFTGYSDVVRLTEY